MTVSLRLLHQILNRSRLDSPGVTTYHAVDLVLTRSQFLTVPSLSFVVSGSWYTLVFGHNLVLVIVVCTTTLPEASEELQPTERWLLLDFSPIITCFKATASGKWCVGECTIMFYSASGTCAGSISCTFSCLVIFHTLLMYCDPG